MNSLASVTVGPLQFDAPTWLILIPVLWAMSLLMARRSMAGLGTTTRWLALAARMIVIALLAGAAADPQWRKENRDVAVTVVLDASESVPMRLQNEVGQFFNQAIDQKRKPENRIGMVTAAKDAYVQVLPSRLKQDLEVQHVGATDGTNLAGAVRLGLAVMPKDAANRLVLASDGNQTVGNVLAAAEAAKAMGVPIDVLPLKYKYENEVIVDKVVAPANAREGETLNVRIVLQSKGEATGRLTLLQNDQAIDLDPTGPSLGVGVALRAGLNVLQVPIAAARSGPQVFKAIFEPESVGGQRAGDSLTQNNQGQSVTFVSGEGRLLMVANTQKPEEYSSLLAALEKANLRVDVRSPETFPVSLTEMTAFDAILMVNQTAYAFTQQQQEELRQYVHDTGGGLVMVGGPESFGAGGWIGSPVEDALPIKLDPPQKRQMPRGALALVIHSCEMPEGVYYGKKVSEAAVNSLSRLDMVGINEYRGFANVEWVLPIQLVGDGTAAKRAIQNLNFGDMPDFAPSIELTLAGLKKVEAGQRHVIIISDGDPSPPAASLLDKYKDARITISTVGVFPHSGGDTSRLKWMSEYTGGRHYEITTQAGLASLPQIFIKEAQTIRRALIWEGPAFTPAFTPGLSESLRGVTSVPAITGYIVAAEREGLSLVSMKGKEGDPILAQWQYGLGKVLTFTSDAASRWNSAWVSWSGFDQFWEQQARWAMRPGGSANVRVVTENQGDQTIVTVEALDSAGERLNFARFQGRLALPGGEGRDVDLKQVGPGRYQGSVRTDMAGSYVMSLRYAAPDDKVAGGVTEGSVQASVTRPFADEYRILEDNTALLTQVAEMTGGRVLNKSVGEDLWLAEGLKIPVATKSVWLVLALVGLGLFLADVGVRRVRIDVRAIAEWTAGLFRGAKNVEGGQQLGALRTARAQTRGKLEERARMTPEQSAAAKAAAQKAVEASKRKFEASPEQMKRNGGGTGGVILGGADAKPEPVKPKVRPGTQGAEDEGMSRLMKAKRKAQDEMKDE